ELAELCAFLESQIMSGLPLRRVQIILISENHEDRDELMDRVLNRVAVAGELPLEDDPDLRAAGFDIAYALRREQRCTGALLIEAAPGALTPDVRAVIEVLAGQIAIAIDDWRLVEENVRLERKLAEGERLAALGQMAATVAHEVKNPLSAIKSIAQVMSEDAALQAHHARDLSLIVGETDRLNKSVTQLLSFAGRQPASSPASSVSEIIRSVVGLFRADAGERNISLRSSAGPDVQLEGVPTAAVRDALSNLILNALQATPGGGEVVLESTVEGDEVVFAVSDTGPGIPEHVREKIW